MNHLSSQLAIGAALCVCLISSLQAQPQSRKFGKIEKAYYEMDSYALDSGAAAVVLYDMADVFFEINREDLKLVYNIHRRYKILSESAIDLADVEILYYGDRNYEEVKTIKGATYTLNDEGKWETYKLDRKSVYKEDLDGNWQQTRFSLPNVKPGSIIEYSYKLYSKDLYSINTHYFQNLHPVVFSEFSINMPEGFLYQPVVLGYMLPESKQGNFSTTDFSGQRKTFFLKNVPAFKSEPYTTTYRNFVPRVSYQLSSISLPGGYYREFNVSWADLNQDLLANVSLKPYLNPGKALKNQAKSLTEDASTPEEGIHKIIAFVRNAYQWNERYGIYPSVSATKILDENESNGAAINYLLLALLRAAGHEAYPVLISTRDHGLTQPIYPITKQFNHVIVSLYTQEGRVLLDGLAQVSAYDMLPAQDLNGQGFEISEKAYQWLELKPVQKGESVLVGYFELSTDGVLSGKVDIKDEGYSAVVHRLMLKQHEFDVDEYMEERLMEEMPEGELISAQIEQEKQVNLPLKTACEFKTEDYTQVVGDFIYLRPMLFEQRKENPFKLEKRTYPVDFGFPIQQQYMFNLVLPDGYTIESLPEAIQLVLPDRSASFMYQVQAIGNRLQLICRLEIKNTLYQPDAYESIKAFFDLIVKKHGEQIVLKKVT